MNNTSDYIEYDVALKKGISLLKDPRKCVVGFYITLSINAGLRASDLLKLKFSDLNDLKENDCLLIEEKKTKKKRRITINKHVEYSYLTLVSELKKQNKYKEDDYIFKSQKNTIYSTVSINRLLKEVFKIKKLNISSHSLRKSFGRKIYDNNNQTEHSLVLLSDIFGHSNLSITRRYLGLREEEIENVYLSL
ncbi:MAG: tyrosine-type recombinase/integrase [Bacteroidota bacterium]